MHGMQKKTHGNPMNIEERSIPEASTQLLTINNQLSAINLLNII